MPKFILSFLILSLFGSCSLEKKEPKNPTEKPNILLIITDDQGYGDLGFHGNPDIKTPILDAFAKGSTRFTNFYVSPVCAPTRSSLMTGRYSLRTGVCDTYNGWAMMSPDERTIAEILKENGYKTGMSGKWHLGDTYPSRPNDQGFDYSLIHKAGGMAQVGDPDTWFEKDSAYFDPILTENGEKVKIEGYCSDIFTDAAIDFISENKDQPFFCYLSFNAPHTPLQLPEKYEAMYADLEIDSTNYPKFERTFPKMNNRNISDAQKIYGMVSNIDDNVGRVLSKLEELQIRENTLIIFMTDNGPQQVRYTGGFRGQKSSVYEGGIHVPLFIQFPKKLTADKEISTPVAHYDMLPTLLDFCGITQPDNLDGKSMKPLTEGQKVDWADRSLFFQWQRGFPEPYRNVAVRKGNFKMVGHAGHLAKASDLELYDLSKDPSEMHNISIENIEKTEELKAEFDNWYEEIMQSPNIDNVKIVIGSNAENPILLSRNDAKGSYGVWAQKEIYGYWDAHIEQDGFYTVKCFFEEPLSDDGRMNVRFGTVQRAVENKERTQEVLIEKIFLKKGDCRIDAGYRNARTWRVEFPFYLEVERI
jgi:arylsulfatase